MNKPVDSPVAQPDIGWRWKAGFQELGAGFGTRLAAQALPRPYFVAASAGMARELGLQEEWLRSAAALEVFSGNLAPAGSTPMATVYSGHQFGVWAGQLGDGRALLLGEVDVGTSDAADAPDAPNGLEVQLKGSGLTPYSRMGDGRAVLRSSIREFLCSEAMHALGIPTTRALCVVGSDAPVYREEAETAAVVTRVAPSLIRFGHFEHFAALDRVEELRTLADYVIRRYYPGCADAASPYAELLRQVSERTATLIAQWQAVGFCHGVMNTDNMSILGLTIDYGPFGFMEAFNPGHICNHSDPQGRYAWNRQPNIAYWNLFALGQALMPLIEDTDAAMAALEPFKSVFPAALDARLNAKLGLGTVLDGDREQANALLKLLAEGQVDWTIFWRRFAGFDTGGDNAALRDLFIDRAAFDAWQRDFSAHLQTSGRRPDAQVARAANPAVVLRNHLAETTIRAAKMKDFAPLDRLHRILQTPFDEHADAPDATGFPPEWAQSLEVSCSS